jgi:endonuclease YncB( thermonuclease family)
MAHDPVNARPGPQGHALPGSAQAPPHQEAGAPPGFGQSVADEAILRAVRLGPDFSFAGFACLAKVVEYYDGDTVRIAFIPAGAAAPVQYKARMLGYDSPELHPLMSRANRVAEKKAAERAREALHAKVGAEGLVWVKCGKFDKYGRVLVTMFDRATGEDLNQWMLANGYGVPYDGGTR